MRLIKQNLDEKNTKKKKITKQYLSMNEMKKNTWKYWQIKARNM